MIIQKSLYGDSKLTSTERFAVYVEVRSLQVPKGLQSMRRFEAYKYRKVCSLCGGSKLTSTERFAVYVEVRSLQVPKGLQSMWRFEAYKYMIIQTYFLVTSEDSVKGAGVFV
jgi:hypothetical protein